MSIPRENVQTTMTFPASPRTPGAERGDWVGRPLDRVDGPAKVQGEARFTADVQLEGLAFAALVCSTVAKGRVRRIDASEARACPGFVTIVTHENAPRMKAPRLLDFGDPSEGFAASNLPILQDDEIHWDGQPLAVVVAETLEQAERAASLVHVEHEPHPARVSFDAETPEVPAGVMGEPAEVTAGADAADGLASADVAVDHTYTTPRYNHNAIEPHATVAARNDDGTLTVFDSTQSVNLYKRTLAGVFGLGAEDVRVLAPFVGGGFGGKAGFWNNTALCAAAATAAKRPVKLVLSREQTFRLVGGRTPSEQRVALGADRDGRLGALIHTGKTATTTHARFPEQFSFPARHLYAPGGALIRQEAVDLDTVANTWMRAPGESIGSFALESAVDELAHALGMDPIELRRINEPESDPTAGTPFSSRHRIAACERGAEAFGWQRRAPAPRSRRDGRWWVGQGVATAFFPVYRFPAAARVRIGADGTARVQAAANEMGMGTATVQLQHAADRLGLAVDSVSFDYGDSSLPDSLILAGGSSQTGTVGAAVEAAVEQAHRELLALVDGAGESPLAGAAYEHVIARDGGLFRVDEPSRGETYSAILQRAGRDFVEVDGMSSMPSELMEYSMASYGAQFCEARVHDETGEVRLSRWVGAFDCGRILNPKTAVSQLRGGIVMGAGMALTESTLFDTRRGRIVNPSLAEYHVPVNLDVPPIDIHFENAPDPQAPLGAHGIGEIGITGAAAAIANAVFDATGKRVRDLPITLDKLM